jgi:hypothetical protein
MNLLELKEKINNAIEYANECNESLEEIKVSIQISDLKGKSIWTNEIELHYDNNIDAAGCVITGDVDFFIPE